MPTDTERLALYMLAEIYQRVGCDELDPAFIRDAVSAGHFWAIRRKYSGIFDSDERTEELALEVGDILSMWNHIEDVVEDLKDEDRGKLQAATVFGLPEFSGFDGNNESDHMSAARMMIDRLDMFPRLKGRSLDAHMGTVDSHRRMLAAYKSILRHNDYKPLSVDELIEIMQSRVHPDHQAEASVPPAA